MQNKIILNTDGVEIEVEVIEQTVINGTSYLLVANHSDENIEDEDNCYILKDISKNDDSDAVYEEVVDENELNDVFNAFNNILEDDDIEIKK